MYSWRNAEQPVQIAEQRLVLDDDVAFMLFLRGFEVIMEGATGLGGCGVVGGEGGADRGTH